MKNNYLKWAVPAMLAVTSIITGDNAGCEIATSDSCGVIQNECTPSYYEYHNRISIFGAYHQAYERIKTDAFYAGVELWSLPFQHSPHPLPSIGQRRHRSIGAIGEMEVRFGYNYFFNGRDHLTPFAGVGVIAHLGDLYPVFFFDTPMNKLRYVVVGFLYDHEFNSVFNLGVNMKGFVGSDLRHTYLNLGSTVVGADVAVPITFRFGNKRHWDLRLEPFGIYIHGSRGSQLYFGGRSTIGYRF